MKWLLKPVYTVDGIVNVFLRSNITLLLLTVIILIHLLYFTIQENWFYVLLLIITTLVSTYICSTGTLALLLTLLTAYIVMIVRNDGFPDFFQDDEYLEGFKRRRRKKKGPKRRFKKPKVKMPKVKNVVKSTIKIAEKNNLKRKAVNMLKKYGKYTPHGQVLLLMMRKDAERRKKLREERRRRAEERRKREEEERRKREEEERRRREEEERRRRDQAARDTVFRQQTRDALDKTNYEINRRKIEFQIQEQERIRRERINNDLSENIPDDAELRADETREFIEGTQVFW